MRVEQRTCDYCGEQLGRICEYVTWRHGTPMDAELDNVLKSVQHFDFCDIVCLSRYFNRERPRVLRRERKEQNETARSA